MDVFNTIYIIYINWQGHHYSVPKHRKKWPSEQYLLSIHLSFISNYLSIDIYITKKNFGLIHVYFLYTVFRATYSALLIYIYIYLSILSIQVCF